MRMLKTMRYTFHTPHNAFAYFLWLNAISIAILSLFNSCSTQNTRYMAEPKSRYGNPKRYCVFNVCYNTLNTANGYRERGIASWYGPNFHGRLTSNREVYDMYSLTAAHKTLPLPTAVQVTNLANNKSIVVRVNDRGPFHDGRIIDLSYAAAQELGILHNGTGMVEVVALTSNNSTL